MPPRPSPTYLSSKSINTSVGRHCRSNCSIFQFPPATGFEMCRAGFFAKTPFFKSPSRENIANILPFISGRSTGRCGLVIDGQNVGTMAENWFGFCGIDRRCFRRELRSKLQRLNKVFHGFSLFTDQETVSSEHVQVFHYKNLNDFTILFRWLPKQIFFV